MNSLSIKWKLKAVDPKDILDWQAQYTGFDPQLDLPAGLDDALAKDFLLSFARFEDVVARLNDDSYRDRPVNKTHKFFKDAAETIRSNSLSGMIKRSSFNTDVLEDSRGHFIKSYLTEYLFSESENFKKLLPDKSTAHSASKAAKKIQRKEEDAIAPFKKTENESWEDYTQRFIGYCNKDPQISAVGFIGYLAKRIKIQYVEPWLIYIGQSIDEIVDACEAHQAPDEIKNYAAKLKDAFLYSGFAENVEKMRGFALSTDAQLQARTIIELPELWYGSVKRVGAVLTENGPVYS